MNKAGIQKCKGLFLDDILLIQVVVCIQITGSHISILLLTFIQVVNNNQGRKHVIKKKYFKTFRISPLTLSSSSS